MILDAVGLCVCSFGVLHSVAVCCSLLQCSGEKINAKWFWMLSVFALFSVLQSFAFCCSMLQSVTVQWGEDSRQMILDTFCLCFIQCAAVCCSMLQSVAACCSVLQSVAVQREEDSCQIILDAIYLYLNWCVAACCSKCVAVYYSVPRAALKWLHITLSCLMLLHILDATSYYLNYFIHRQSCRKVVQRSGRRIVAKWFWMLSVFTSSGVWQSVAVCCRLLQAVAVYCSLLQWVGRR